ncbi:glycosyltransferase [Anaerostipes sp. 992a]|uniref:glycosyltransferase family 2 protein n=1 Tax=Anaerostipes sp. 992a TaxID=1261637 RepID=UPI0009531192|nr:glycosyltransferase family 2 protein [Anaerostipes sp. 992a]OLR62172.1 glycosyltransferase [Anaerostipes sp. 992a]
MNNEKRLTVFTPTYNRAHTLPRTYDSLLKQECKDFVWLIIDDGSNDNTSELVKEWQKKDNGFEIRYIYKENGGMHTAHNTAYENIDTDLNICIDSDDALAEGAVGYILSLWDEKGNDRFAGIIGLDADMNGNIIGTMFPDTVQETTLYDFYNAGGTGDKKLVYRTDIMKSLPSYPVFVGEKYISLGYKYQLCDQKYTLLTTNQILCNVEYQPDGSSNNMYMQYIKNPKGFAFIRKENMKYIKSHKRNFIDCIHYVSSSILAHNYRFISESPKKVMTILAIPFGLMLTIFLKIKTIR